jgi:hypothetical protein
MGITDPARWYADTGGGLDAALAATVTLATNDVLLDQLLAELEEKPLAQRLLFAASVYRIPVDETGLIWLVGEPVEHVPDPARQARLQEVSRRLQEARKTNPIATFSDVASSKEELEQWVRDVEAERRAPVKLPEGFSTAKELLIAISLLATVRFVEDEKESFVVHRWKAGALAERTSDEQAKAAHGAAAAYWRWRVKNLPQPSHMTTGAPGFPASRSRPYRGRGSGTPFHRHSSRPFEARHSDSGRISLPSCASNRQTWKSTAPAASR